MYKDLNRLLRNLLKSASGGTKAADYYSCVADPPGHGKVSGILWQMKETLPVVYITGCFFNRAPDASISAGSAFRF
ncbi:hypothetical protein [Thermoactinomyces mirandus]|uniref:hypothetical protein n=1 Tax=Thermoactinomyces mirandus TaxID=2756294 RepID=UPI0015EEFC8B|nr:hypothetical protein [Thermoactinomyces mirandus]